MSLPSKIGKYEIQRQIGKGSMGEVFLGCDTALGRNVAIKTILSGSSFGAEARQRFEREARATAALNHPNIVTVYEFGETDGLHYLVMEFVEGEDLESLIQKGERSKTELLEALAQACEGLAFAHERGIIHRDLKPGNILVSLRGKRLQAKLTDFGVALVDRSTLTEQDVRMGTVSYMAPEYLESGRATTGTDIFAAGVMLYEILSGGRRPFAAETPMGILNAILRTPAAPLRPDEVREFSPLMLDVSRKSLAKDPQDRFQDAEGLASAIRSALEAPAAAPSGAQLLQGQPLVVGKGGNVLSLRVALRQAQPGTSIRILPGTYRESVLVDKDLTLIGEGLRGEIILECPEDGGLVLQAARIQMENISIRQPQAGKNALVQVRSGITKLRAVSIEGGAGPALQVDSGAEVQLNQGNIIGGSIGIRLRPGSQGEFQDCLVEGCRTGLRLEGGASASLSSTQLRSGKGLGLQLGPASQASLEDCEVEAYQGGGAELEADARLKLKRCRFHESEGVGVLVLEKGQTILEDCELSGHRDSGIHITSGGTAQVRQCRLTRNKGYGLSLLGSGLASMVDCEISSNGSAGILIHRDATAQIKNCRITDGEGPGIECAEQGQGILEGCEIARNAGTGAQVAPGGSLLLARCTVKDSQETGLMLFENAHVTLEECVIHRNARGGILLAKDAADPVLRGGNQLEDDLFRTNAQGNRIKVAPLRK